MPVIARSHRRCRTFGAPWSRANTLLMAERIVGRRAGVGDDFRYSRALLGARIVWDEKALDAFLAEPQAFIAGTRMPFGGIPDRRERANLISYLGTLR